MSDKYLKHVISLIVISIAFFSCTRENPLDAYIRYLDSINTILANDKGDIAFKSSQIRKYVEQKKSEIEKTLSEIKTMTTQDMDKRLDRMRFAINNLADTITTISQKTPEISEYPDIINTLKLLKIIDK